MKSSDSQLISLAKKHPGFVNFCSHIYAKIFGLNHGKKKGKKCDLYYKSSLLRKNRFVWNKNKNNKITIGSYCLIEGCSFFFSGNNNLIEIEDGCHLDRTEFIVEGDGNLIHIGKETRSHAFSRFSAIEGTKIIIGERCALSADINARTGDTHFILDQNGKRINPSEDIRIGNHVWVGYHVIVLKGAVIPDDSIVGSGSVVTSSIGVSPSHSVFVGVPARQVKTGVSWDH